MNIGMSLDELKTYSRSYCDSSVLFISFMKRLLFIEYSRNKNNSNGYRKISLIQAFQNARYQVSVISNNNDYLQIADVYYHVNILRIQIFLSYVIKTILNFFCVYIDTGSLFIRKYKHAVKAVLLNNSFDAIIVCVAPFSLYKLGNYIKKYTLSTLILDQCDPLFCNVVYLQRYSSRKIDSIKLFEEKELIYFDKIVVLNDRLKNIYEKAMSSLHNKFFVVEQGFSMFEDKVLSNKSNLSINKKISFIYAGKFYEYGIRDPLSFYNAFDSFDQLNFILIGESRNKFFPCFLNASFQVYGSLPIQQVNYLMLQSDVIVFFDNFKGYQVPGKLFDCIAMRKPILYIYNVTKSIDDFDIKCDYIYYAHNDEQSIKVAIMNILDHINDKIEVCQDINKYQWEVLVNNKYIPLL